MNSGGTLVFNPSRVYLKRKHVVVRKPGVRLWGYGAILYSYLTPQQIEADNGPDENAFSAQISLQLRAPGTSVYGLTFISNLRARLVGTQAHAGVLLTSQMHEVIDNRFEYTQNGVRVRGESIEAPASEFVIARNVVYRTTADGIVVMTNSTNGRVLCNVVRENGDDMISVLDYGLGEPDDVWKILIEGNDLAGTYKGRGITVHGGRDVTIRGNTVAQTTRNAGIMIRGGPDTYLMANVRNVLVEDNMIKDIQTTLPVYSPLPDWKRTGQGAIDIAGYGELSDIVVRNNTIQSTGYDGILIRGNAERIGLFANRLYSVGTTPIDVQARSGTITCLENVYNDAYVSSSACSGTAIPPVTGAQM
jgi:hypothetical protein